MEKVYIARCESYEYELVKEAVFECMDNFPGLKEKLIKGSKVLVKANLLMRKSPEEAATTHPAVVEAIVNYIQKNGCTAIIGDSPGGPYTERALKAIYKATGMEAVAERTGCQLNYDTASIDVWDESSKLLKAMKIIKIAKEVDLIISAAKLKTHGMMTYTGAVKNLFGVIPGLIKAEYHFKMNNIDNFAEHLIDICEHIKPAFSIIDAVECMEGNGPSAGDIRKLGLILSSENPYALDTAAAYIAGIKSLSIPTIRTASARGIFSGDIKELQIDGVKLEAIKAKPFKLPDSVISINFVGNRVPKFMEKVINGVFRPSPIFDLEKCVSCGDCKRSCPPDVIDMSGGKPEADLSKCIRCFCCHELCPKKAISIKKHWLYERLFK